MKPSLHFLTAFLLLSLCPRSSEASALYSGTVIGTFTTPVLIGQNINLDHSRSILDNTSTGVFTGLGTSSFTWGTNTPGVPPPIASRFIFTGIPFTNVAPGVQFDLGTFKYLNGTSRQDSLVFGTTLTLSVMGTSGITPEVSHISILSTTNGNVDASGAPDQFADADFATFDTFSVSFNVFEGAEATATLRGAILGDPQLKLQAITLPPNDPNGFLGTGQGSSIPEPGSAVLMGLGLAGLALIRLFPAARR